VIVTSSTVIGLFDGHFQTVVLENAEIFTRIDANSTSNFHIRIVITSVHEMGEKMMNDVERETNKILLRQDRKLTARRDTATSL
jgi:hypothetical protein